MPSLKKILNHHVDPELAHNILLLWALLIVAPLTSGILVFELLPLIDW